jgi:hypothetical protein
MSTYSEYLKDPKWQKKRLKIFEKAKFQCTSCGDDEKTLHVHHTYYSKGKKPWEYPDASLHALCKDCHKDVEILRTRFNEVMGLVSPLFPSQITGYTLGKFAEDHPQVIFRISNAEEIVGISDYWGIKEDFIYQHLTKNSGNISGKILGGLAVEHGNLKSWLKNWGDD